MSKLVKISNSNIHNPNGEIVFVHGLNGNHLKTWKSSDRGDSFWPKWLADDFPKISIWTLEYDASPSKWHGESMPLLELATNILDLFETEGIGNRSLLFVCHSLMLSKLLRTT